MPRSLVPSNPDTRYKLIIDIQKQLKRLGCYYGRVDGSWGMGSKYAMQEFIDRVNATCRSMSPTTCCCRCCNPKAARSAARARQIRRVRRPLRAAVDHRRTQRSDDAQPPRPEETLPWKATAAAAAQPQRAAALYPGANQRCLLRTVAGTHGHRWSQ